MSMNQNKAVFHLHWQDAKISLYYMWGIFSAITFLLPILLYFLNHSGENFIGGFGSVYIFLMIFAMISLKETFPYALGMGCTRKRYMIGTILFLSFFAALNSLLLIIYSWGIHHLMEWLTPNTLIFVSIFSLQKFAVWHVFLAEFLIALSILSFFQLGAALFHRFGFKPFLIFFALLLILPMIPWNIEILGLIEPYFAAESWIGTIMVVGLIQSLICFFCTWLVLRNSPSKSLRG